MAAELGIVGLIALAATAWSVFRAVRHTNDPLATMGIAALAGFIAHQMFDVPAMMPAIALVALAVLVLATPATVSPKRKSWQPALIAVGGGHSSGHKSLGSS